MARVSVAPESPRPHPFVRLGKFIIGKVTGKSKGSKYEAENANDELRQKKTKKKGGWFSKKSTDDSDEEEDDVDIWDQARDEGELYEGVSDDGMESEIYEDEAPATGFDTQLPGEAEMLSRAPEEAKEEQIYETIERLPFKEVQSVRETVHKLHPKFQNTADLIPEEKLTRAVIDRVARTRQATMYNALLSFGPVEQAGPTMGHAPDRVPSTIMVTGQRGAGNDIIFGIYERYPDDFHKRPVYQKHLDKHEMKQHGVRFSSSGPRDEQTEIGACRNAAFLYFDNRSGNWCIAERPGQRAVWARCPGTEEAVPDGLNRWEVWIDKTGKDGKWCRGKGVHTLRGGDAPRDE